MEILTTELFEALLDWYEENKRVLPWREEVADPYHVWVSEIMLQQTRVETVRSYYLRWMERFPTVQALAAASEEDVLKAWEGLGYYSRARNLHKAAKLLTEKCDGVLPREKAALLKLPGIGEYTAGAIRSIAFGEKEPAVDGNVLRVVSRLTADPTDIMRAEMRAAIADKLRPLMPTGKTSSFTQAIFEIGALICLPQDAYRCDLCPLRDYCLACAQGRQKDFPVKSEKADKKSARLTVLVLYRDGKYALRKRPTKGLLANLYELPNLDGHLSEEEIRELFPEGSVTDIQMLPAATHVFTHIVWDMRGYLVRTSGDYLDAIWVTPEEMARAYPLPSAFSAYKKYCK